jgi:anthranilate phosphoribosyltransferase
MTIIDSLVPKTGEHPFAPVVRILGKGKHGSRSLSFEEAEAAMRMILRGEVDDVQLGAFLMLLRVKEESPEEIAGFVSAVRATMQIPSPAPQVVLDWPSYAGKRAQHPWFVLAALLLQQVGISVLMHGSAGHTAHRLYTEQVVKSLGLPCCDQWSLVGEALEKVGFAYLPLETFCPPLQRIIELRNILGLRSPVHTLTRLINPLQAQYSMQSVFHPAYASIHQSAAEILAAANTAVFKGESGEIERKPDAVTTVRLHRHGINSEVSWPRLQAERQPDVDLPTSDALRELWRDEKHDAYGVQAVLGTTAIALLLCERADSTTDAMNTAEELWATRPRHRI